MFFKIGGTVGAIAILLSGTVASLLQRGYANAQDAERYVTVGHDKGGNSVALDTKTISGTTYKLYGLYGDGIFETTFSASCGESRLFLNRVAIYGTEGQLLEEDKENEEIPFVASSSPGKAMRIICQKIGANGW